MPAPRIPRPVAHGKPKPNLRRRVQHLAFVRQLPCVTCGKAAPSDAAHVRTGTDGGIEAGRSLRRSSVHRLPCEAASGRRACLLVRAPHRSSQCGFAAVDCVIRCRGRGAHRLSGATTDQSGEGIWLRDTPSTERLDSDMPLRCRTPMAFPMPAAARTAIATPRHPSARPEGGRGSLVRPTAPPRRVPLFVAGLAETWPRRRGRSTKPRG
jgi:hypothetical protein